MDAEQVLAFRLARSGLARREARTLADAAACPASDFSRDAALLALAARHADVTRESYAQAIGRGDIVVAHIVRGAIHVLAPGDHAAYGGALIATDDEELGVQLGRQVQRLAAEHGFTPSDALDEVDEATRAALGARGALSREELHEELRGRVRAPLMPWCKGCRSHHVAPMLWRYAGVKAGARLDAERRYVLGRPGRGPADGRAVLRFLAFYGPADAGDFAAWAGLARSHAARLWERVAGELAEVPLGRRRTWALRGDLGPLESPPAPEGVRLLPPGDPYLQKPNRSLLTPGEELRKRLFRPVASPGVVIADGRVAGAWRVKGRRGRTEITVESLEPVPRAQLEEEACRIAELRDGSRLSLVVG